MKSCLVKGSVQQCLNVFRHCYPTALLLLSHRAATENRVVYASLVKAHHCCAALDSSMHRKPALFMRVPHQLERHVCRTKNGRAVAPRAMIGATSPNSAWALSGNTRSSVIWQYHPTSFSSAWTCCGWRGRCSTMARDEGSLPKVGQALPMIGCCEKGLIPIPLSTSMA